MDAWQTMLIYNDGYVTRTLSLSQSANIWEENAVKIVCPMFNNPQLTTQLIHSYSTLIHLDVLSIHKNEIIFP